MEHLTYELNSWRLVWVRFFKVHDESKCAVLERSVCRADDNSIPEVVLDT